jgi:type II secretory pathway pseudopilin PulG
MAVVAIMGVLSTLAVVAFRKRAFSSNLSEAQGILRAIGAAEEGYRALNHVYLDASPTQAWYPTATIPSNRKVSFVPSAHADLARWQRLGVKVQQPVGFGFIVQAGLPNQALPGLASTAIALDPNSGIDPWYVAQARADADGDGTACVVVSASFTPNMAWANEGE